MDLDRYIGKQFTLLLTDEEGEVVAYGGWTASLSGETLLLERPGDKMKLEPDWLQRIQPISDDQSRKLLLGADFVIRLSVGPNPREEDTDIPTGMRWPPQE